MLEKLKKKAAAALPKVVKAAETVGKEIGNKTIELTRRAVGKLTESPAQKLLGKAAAAVPSYVKKAGNFALKTVAAVPKVVEAAKKETVREIQDSKTQLAEFTKLVSSGAKTVIFPGSPENKTELSEKNQRIREKYLLETQRYHEEVERGKTQNGALRYYTCTSEPVFNGLYYLLQLRKAVVEEYPILALRANKYRKDKELLKLNMDQVGNEIYDLNIPLVSDYVGAFTMSSHYKENGNLTPVDGTLNQVLKFMDTVGVNMISLNKPALIPISALMKLTNHKENENEASKWGALHRGFIIDGAAKDVDGIISMRYDPFGTAEGFINILKEPVKSLSAMYNGVTGYVNDKIIHGSPEDRAEFKGALLYEIASYIAIMELSKSAEVSKVAKDTTMSEGVTSKTGVSINNNEVVIDNIDDAGKAAMSGSGAEKGLFSEGAGQVAKGGSNTIEINNPVLDNIRSGSALKEDSLHAFNDIIDNYAGQATEFPLVGGDGVERSLYQIEGSLNGKNGIFEWIVDPDPVKGVTHRRFIEGVRITGKPNARP
ncbi:hypothetical protein [Clostridium sp. Marseille-P2415]|uniref:hypothetical protein n=1 Tax=Clostridium sp. Marseille-P2415 TaxID=1805471 RepID=UPI0009884BEE|nr:hypothetical protein [Clostridium sp. Marseille-P2415]